VLTETDIETEIIITKQKQKQAARNEIETTSNCIWTENTL